MYFVSKHIFFFSRKCSPLFTTMIGSKLNVAVKLEEIFGSSSYTKDSTFLHNLKYIENIKYIYILVKRFENVVHSYSQAFLRLI